MNNDINHNMGRFLKARPVRGIHIHMSNGIFCEADDSGHKCKYHIVPIARLEAFRAPDQRVLGP